MIAHDVPPAAPPEYRQDPVTGLWTIIASERAGRPMMLPFGGPFPDDSANAGNCAFCPGNEDQTPEATSTVPASASNSEWRIRVFPNSFPGVRQGSFADLQIAEKPVDEFWQSKPGLGFHEVVVERPEHLATLGDLPQSQWLDLLQCFQSRVRAFSASPNIGYVSVFKNCGPSAGASQLHAHSQIIATAFVPPWIQLEYDRCRAHFLETGRHLLDEVATAERSAGQRLVVENPGAVAFCPFASRFPFETWLMPKSGGRFADATSTELAALADIFGRCVDAIESTIPNAAYNFYLHDVPIGEPAEGYRWHFEIVGRIIGVAGFELGGGGFLNPVPPEWAAAKLRTALRVSSQ